MENLTPIIIPLMQWLLLITDNEPHDIIAKLCGNIGKI